MHAIAYDAIGNNSAFRILPNFRRNIPRFLHVDARCILERLLQKRKKEKDKK